MKQLKTESDKAMEVPLPEVEDVDSETEEDDEEEEDTDAKIKHLLEENARLVEVNAKSTEENKVSIRVKVEPFDCSIAAHSFFND
jgi:FKBP-type peptidyl-prolyl cis-trans isomerase (trigger factor)